jgi:hypothetical protein
MTCFDVLGLTAEATVDEIKAAYRRLAMERHPDRGGDEKEFVELQAAYEEALALAGAVEPFVLRVAWPDHGGAWERRLDELLARWQARRARPKELPTNREATA